MDGMLLVYHCNAHVHVGHGKKPKPIHILCIFYVENGLQKRSYIYSIYSVEHSPRVPVFKENTAHFVSLKCRELHLF